MEDELIRENKGLIYIAIKDLHIFWKTQDDYQDYIDAGYDGLLNGIRTYDKNKGIKQSTYYYTCIRNEICKTIVFKNRKKNQIETISYNTLINEVEGIELIDCLPSSVDVEKEVITKEQKERLNYLVDHLPNERDRLVIKMYFGLDGWEQLTIEKIAKRWGVNKNVIITRKNRALNRLWLKLKSEGL